MHTGIVCASSQTALRSRPDPAPHRTQPSPQGPPSAPCPRPPRPGPTPSTPAALARPPPLSLDRSVWAERRLVVGRKGKRGKGRGCQEAGGGQQNIHRPLSQLSLLSFNTHKRVFSHGANLLDLAEQQVVSPASLSGAFDSQSVPVPADNAIKNLASIK